jgi:Subtilase family
MLTAIRRAWPLVAVALLTLALTAAGSQAANGGKGKRPADVVTKTDAAKGKLDTKLQAKVESGETQAVPIFASLTGDVAAAKSLVQNAKVAQHEGFALLVGSIPTQLTPKLASLDGVISVGLVEFKQTGEPTGWQDPDLAGGHDPNKNARALWKKTDVPYSQAPPLKTSNFDALKGKGYLDAKTHNFDGAWAQGFAGEGITASVLDGGTDWGHPDLLGTWQTWSNGPWAGWPMAFDPYDTLVWLAAPQFVDQGLSWYTPTTAVTCPGGATKSGTCPVQFATRIGPSRNLAAPDATTKHVYQFPSSYSKSGTVRMTWHPDDYLLATYGERPAVLVTDPNTAGVYDTVYVDLDDDYDFSDEKPVTKSSPASYRDMNGDGYTDLSGGLLTFISDGQTLLPGGIDAFDDGTPAFTDAFTFGPGEMLMWTGDYDPGIGGHGTLTASNVVGQAVVNGAAPTFADFGKTPGAVLGGAPKAKLAPIGDIYFSFSFSTQLGYLLTALNGVDVTSNSYGSSNVDNDGFDAASDEADIIHFGFNSGRTTPIFSTGNGAPGYGTTTPPTPVSGINVGASTQFGGTGWDSVKNLSQIADNDVVVWSNRGPGATGKPGVDVVADGAYSAGDITLNATLDGRFSWETWGGTSRSTPVTVGAAALVYQAYKASHGGAEPNFQQVKRFLKSSATDLKYDSFTQGSGSLDAGQAVKTAIGSETTISPDQWRAGTYRGAKPGVFPHLLAPGQSDSQAFALAGGSGTWNASARILKRVASVSKDFTSKPVAQESVSNFNAPDYLFDLSADIAAHPGADLMVVRANYPRAQFDGNADYAVDQAWRLLLYKFNDQDGDHSCGSTRTATGSSTTATLRPARTSTHSRTSTSGARRTSSTRASTSASCTTGRGRTP